ncbi:hypothetical protein BBK14_15710 [Parafrankia soli]|uniref:ABC transporter domain-containing protein n=1 Tax=Parafrankia soli TaxID=2599596 RepID=A0A1S1QDV3_9ACTN|nr:ATP-binding cassette domain-containing protein [Parafrankia soli]OHV32150.1 hypothetical protein BBK14_15710 [Parafrankia soli]
MTDERAGFAVEVTDLTVRRGGSRLVDGVSFALRPGVVAGLLGRGGAGRSTILAILAAYGRPSAGTVRVDGADPFEDPRLMSEICLVREQADVERSLPVGEALSIAGDLRPRWDAALADHLAARFGLDRRAKVRDLSRGGRTALSLVIGLAARAPLTIFDEPHLGLDAPSRAAFHEELRADHRRHPRTVVLCTDLIDEIAPLLEEVVILDRGRLLLHTTADEARALGHEITGPVDAVGALVGDARVLAQRQLGSTRSTTVLGPIPRLAAAPREVEIGPVSLQDLVSHLTGGETTRR